MPELWKYTMENIMLGRHLHMQTGLFRGIAMWGKRSFAGREEVKHRQKVEEIIDFLDLQVARNQLVGGLPYGIQKQIELGRALALEPESPSGPQPASPGCARPPGQDRPRCEMARRAATSGAAAPA